MSLKFDSFTAPAYWASALVNDDRTGLSDDEESAMNEWLEANDIGYVVDCSHEGIGRFDGMLCDVCTYTYQVIGGA
jgi:hypothetical protein